MMAAHAEGMREDHDHSGYNKNDDVDHGMDHEEHEMHHDRDHRGERRHHEGRDRMDRAMHMRKKEDRYLCNQALDIFHTLVAHRDEPRDDGMVRATKLARVAELVIDTSGIFGGASSYAVAGAAATVLATALF